MTATAKLFMHGRSQAVRLPKEFRLPGKEVRVSRDGNKVVLEPIARTREEIAAVFAEIDRNQGRGGVPVPGTGPPEDPPAEPRLLARSSTSDLPRHQRRDRGDQPPTGPDPPALVRGDRGGDHDWRSAIVLFELATRSAKSNWRVSNEAGLRAFLSLAVTAWSFEPEDAEHAGDIRADPAMPPLPARFAGVILAFAPLFVHRSWQHAQVLLIGQSWHQAGAR